MDKKPLTFWLGIGLMVVYIAYAATLWRQV
jgi:hypothetical protein